MAGDLVEARWLSAEVGYDVLVLDVQLPNGNGDGIDFCAELRARGDTTAVLLLTSQAEVTDRVHGLDSGADDFLAKPFSAAELAARLEGVARRVEPKAEGPMHVGDLLVDPASRSVTRDGQRITLSAREFAFVYLLARTPGRIVTRAEIFDVLRDFAAGPDANTLDVLVRAVRVKLDRSFTKELLHTVRGIGHTLQTPTPAAGAGTGDTRTSSPGRSGSVNRT